ncbi:GSCOCG00005920001-RA-CDS [Cotesia congregata]|nr:GSCOCG00005920001-RA-CDS [Cotesia congregata]
MEVESNIECFWSDLKTHPKCPHGPTLLFAMRVKDDLKHFYACSACRDRKLCKFYLKKDGELTENEKKKWQNEIKTYSQMYNHQKSYIRFHELLSEQPERRAYCHTCEKLISVNEISKHPEHEVVKNISNDQMYNPTTLLKPRTDSKKEAQYLFSKKATSEIVDLLINLGAKHVLCIGAPRIHEHISQNHEDKLSSLLLDFDGRFHDFFGPLSFCWYNLFNHHFFNKESQSVFKDFITQNNGKDIYVVCDPPFGGRVEPMSQTIKTISDLHKKWNGLSQDDELKVMLFMPYFMKSIIQFKSNPAGVDGGLKELKMAEYKVDYDNHTLFGSGSNGRKFGSPVRIFTNIPLNLIKLLEDDGYKYCKRCDKWVGAENKHCKKCKACTSEDGRRYKHCNICNRCVKPTWKHCQKCKRCALEKHFCGSKPKISGHCTECNKTDHVSKDCPEIVGAVNDSSAKSSKKRKASDDNSMKNNKKQKLNGSDTIEVKKNKKKKDNKIKKHQEDEIVEEEKINAVEFTEKIKLEKTKKKKLKIKGVRGEITETSKENGHVKEKTTDKTTNGEKKGNDNSKVKKKKRSLTELESGSKIMLHKKVKNVNSKLNLKKISK